MASDSLHDRGKTLEDIFFAERDRQLISALKVKAAQEKATVDLASITGIQNVGVLARVAELGVEPDTLAAFATVPLLYVAWADTVLDEAERKAILVEAASFGVVEGAPAYDLLQGWLHRDPDPGLVDAWKAYHASLAPLLTDSQRASLRDELMEKARAIARASGGLLGFGSISADEREALRKLDELLA